MSPRDLLEQRRIERAVQRFREGTEREASFRWLVEFFYRSLHAFFGRRGHGKEDAHDLTQDTFVRIYEGMEDFRGEAGFETWLYAVAFNVSRQSHRRRVASKRGAGQEPGSLDDQTIDPATRDPSPLDRAIGNQDLSRLRRAMAELPPKMRTVLKLSIHQERSRKEIALAMGVSEETVKAHLHQARKKLSEALERMAKPEKRT